jgi:hypothetical protein
MTVTAPSPTAPKAPHTRGFGVKGAAPVPAVVQAQLMQCHIGVWTPIGYQFRSEPPARLGCARLSVGGLSVTTRLLTTDDVVARVGVTRTGYGRRRGPVASCTCSSAAIADSARTRSRRGSRRWSGAASPAGCVSARKEPNPTRRRHGQRLADVGRLSRGAHTVRTLVGSASQSGDRACILGPCP